MSRKKKIAIILLLICVSGFLLTACINKPKQDEIIKENSSKELPFFADKSWIHYDAIIGENYVLTFNRNGEFWYHCECGEPIGNSDIYESYSYESAKNRIRLQGESVEDEFIKILAWNEPYLVLELFGEMIEFYPQDDDEYEYPAVYCQSDMFEAYTSYHAVVAMGDTEITLGLPEVNVDYKNVKENLITYPFSKEITYYVAANKTIKEQDGGEIITTEYRKISSSKVKKLISNKNVTAFVWQNKKLEITKLVFWE